MWETRDICANLRAIQFKRQSPAAFEDGWALVVRIWEWPLGAIDLSTLPVISPAEKGLFGESRELQLGVCNHSETHVSACITRRELFYRGKGKIGRDCSTERVLWRKLWVWGTVAFHWPNCDNPSLAGLLTGKEEIFLPLVGIVKLQVSFYGRCKVHLFLLGSADGHQSSCFQPSQIQFKWAFLYSFSQLLRH